MHLGFACNRVGGSKRLDFQIDEFFSKDQAKYIA